MDTQSQKILPDDDFERCPHDAENPFAQISRALIRDETISMQCIGLLTYLLANVVGWRINAKQIIKHFKLTMGRDRVYSAINEAIRAGYLQRLEYKDDKGMPRIKYRISETPKFKKSLPLPENPDTGNPDTGNPDTGNPDAKEEHLKEEHLKEEHNIGGKPPTPQPKSSIFLQGKVKMPQEKYDKLVADFGKAKVDEKVFALEEYADVKPKHFKEYGCHAAVLRKWIRKDIEDRGSTPELDKLAEKNTRIAQKFKEHLAAHGKEKSIIIDKNGVKNEYTGDSILLNLPSETFEEILCNWFGVPKKQKEEIHA